jgi:putative endonuclease
MDQDQKSLGESGEKIAADFLEKAGFRIVERNFRFGQGEIDLIGFDGNELVFVEVKTRRTGRYGPPEEAVTPAKRRQIRRIAEGYLFRRHIDGIPCRFDVLAIEQREGITQIRHLRGAF